MNELTFIVLLGVSNIALGVGAGIYLARKLAALDQVTVQKRGALALMLGMYFMECVAFSAGMATQVFTIGLGFVWGVIVGRLMRSQAPLPSLRFAFQAALFTCLPTATFAIFVPIAWALAGNNLLSVESGHSFGIPEWIPWPLGSVGGFAVALLLGTVLFKSVITVGEVSLFLHLAGKAEFRKEALDA